MKVSLNQKYELIVTPENDVDALALSAWSENKDKTLLIMPYEIPQGNPFMNSGRVADMQICPECLGPDGEHADGCSLKLITKIPKGR